MDAIKFKNNPEEKEFYTQLKDKVFKELNGRNFYGNADFWKKGIFWSIVSYSSYFFLFSDNINKLVFWFLFLIFQLAGLLIGFSLGHDAAHNTAFKSKKANAILHFFSFMTIGIDPLLWGLRHIRSHHLYANVEGSDIDIDKNPFLRLSPVHPWKNKHKYQHIYAPFVYMLALIHSVFMGDWIYLFSKDYDWMTKGISKRELYIRFIIFKILYFSLVIALPIVFSNFSWQFVIITYLTTGGIAALLFIIMLVGTHFFIEAAYPESNDGEIEHTWAVHQLMTSCDWNADKKWARFISGGANCHAAHHLFPNVCHTYYKKINPIIEDTTQEFNIVYHNKTLSNMMISHLKHLKEMGKS